MNLDLQSRIDCYRVQRKLGEGGMGEVYLALDESLGRNVAIKVIRPSSLEDQKARQRFRREARTAATLSHPSIVQTFRFVEDWEQNGEKVDCLVMEYVAGKTLSELLAQGRLPFETAIRIFLQIAEGLAYAHSQGVIHRDLKVENIVLTPEVAAKILDFGLAKQLTARESSISQAGNLVGTLYSMAPEQAAGRPVDYRADLFSLGVLGYQLFTGRRPFNGETAHAIWINVMHNAHAPILQSVPTLPIQLAGLIEDLLSKDPADRPQQANQVVATLMACQPNGEADFVLQPAAKFMESKWRTGLEGASTQALPRPRPQSRPWLFSFALVGVLTAFMLSLPRFQPKAVEKPRWPVVAVLPLDGEGAGLCRSLLEELWQGTQGVALRRKDFVQIATDLAGVLPGQELSPAQAAVFQKQLGADYLITGRCVRDVDRILLGASLISARDAKILSSRSTPIKSANWVESILEVHREFTRALGVVNDTEFNLLFGSLSKHPDVLLNMSEGLSALEVGSTAAIQNALGAFSRGLSIEKDNPRLLLLKAKADWQLRSSLPPAPSGQPDPPPLLPEPPSELTKGSEVSWAERRSWAMRTAERMELMEDWHAAAKYWSYLAASSNGDSATVLEPARTLILAHKPQQALVWLEHGPEEGILLRVEQKTLAAASLNDISRHSEAEAEALSALKFAVSSSQKAPALVQLGTALAGQRKFSDAQIAFEESLSLYINMGKTQESLHTREKLILLWAKQAFRSHVQKEVGLLIADYRQYRGPLTAVRLSNSLAINIERTGDYQTSLELFSSAMAELEALGLKSEAAMVQQNRAGTFALHGQPDNARRDYQEAAARLRLLAESVPFLTIVLEGLVEVDLMEGHLSSAEQTLAEIFSIAPEPTSLAMPHFLRAQLYRKQGRIALAAADLAKSAELLAQDKAGNIVETWLLRNEATLLELDQNNVWAALVRARTIVRDLGNLRATTPSLPPASENALYFLHAQAKLNLARVLFSLQSDTSHAEARELLQSILQSREIEMRPHFRNEAKQLLHRLLPVGHLLNDARQ